MVRKSVHQQKIIFSCHVCEELRIKAGEKRRVWTQQGGARRTKNALKADVLCSI